MGDKHTAEDIQGEEWCRIPQGDTARAKTAYQDFLRLIASYLGGAMP